VVSGDLCLYAKRHVAYWHGATLQDELSSNVAKLLKHEIIKDACTRGFSWFDFNPSAGLDGVKFFKQGFNCEVLPAPIVYVDTPLKRLARSCAAAVRVQYAELALQPLNDVVGGAPGV
jgi:lipid II:glycine glycyltransferase (peptidoglycan interpeptide bridge formation enzyme)